jgi:RNA polymerase sigma-70 factor (ECF subfamily)
MPLIQIWLMRVPGLGDEAADLAQDVWVVVVRDLPRFERIREGSFRTWLRRVTVNRIRIFWRQHNHRATPCDGMEAFLSQLEDPVSSAAKQWDREHDEHVFRQLLAIVQPEFKPTTWTAFLRSAVDGLSAAEIALELKISENSVLLAKSRVLKRLRVEAEGLID